MTLGWWTARRAARSGAGWGAAMGLVVASAALGYSSAYRTLAERRHLAGVFGANAGLAAIAGPAHDLSSVAGYTAWKSFMTLAVVGSAWGLLTATRLLRWEEEAGRSELFLAGPVDRRRAPRQMAAGLLAGGFALWAAAAVVEMAAGRSSKVGLSSRPLLFFALATTAPAVLFMAVGAVTSQLAPTRRQASTWAAVVLGASFGIRMVADSTPSLGWLRWASPIGWAESLRPLTGSDLTGLIPLTAITATSISLALFLATRRDLGSGLLADGPSSERRRPPSGVTAMALRLSTPTAVAWAVGVAAMALVLGLVAKQGQSALDSSPTVTRYLSHLGVHGLAASAFLGFSFLILAAMAAAAAAGQVSAIRDEESSGRLDNLLVLPVSGPRWLLGRAAVSLSGLVLLGLVAGAASWAGAALEGSGVSPGGTLLAGLGAVAPAVCLFGLATLAFGVRPRVTPFVAYGLLAWSVLIELTAGATLGNHWVMDTSPLHHLDDAPAGPPGWTANLVMLAIGLTGVLIGALTIRRRDSTGP